MFLKLGSEESSQEAYEIIKNKLEFTEYIPNKKPIHFSVSVVIADSWSTKQ